MGERTGRIGTREIADHQAINKGLNADKGEGKVKKAKKASRFRTALKIFFCSIVACSLFIGGRALGKGIASGDITWDSLSLSSLASLPVFSMFLDADPGSQEADALKNMQKNADDDGQAILDGEAINILLMGVDARNPNENSRSDTMILLSVDVENQQVAMISIPRDTKITTEKGVTEQINAVNASAGPEAACDEVVNLL